MKTKDPFTYQIIGLAMKSHRDLGPGLDEEFYHQDLAANLRGSGIEHLSKPRKDLIYKGCVADTFEADLVFPGNLVAELKALRQDFHPEHLTQALCYCKFWRIQTGMLFDFGKASLIHKRIVYTSRTDKFPTPDIPRFVRDRELAENLIELADQAVSEIGLGYRPMTWTGIMCAAMQSARLPFAVNPSAPIAKLGTTELPCIAVNSEAALSISALGDQVTAMDRARLQTCLKWLELPWGLCLHFGKDKVDLRFVSHPESEKQICGFPESAVQLSSS